MLQTVQQWTETSAFFTWLRESPSIWAFPTVFFVHTIGLIFTAGASLVICARLLGAAPELPLPPFARYFRLIWIGFWLTAISGAFMVMSDLEAKLANRLFPLKMAFVAVAVILMLLLRRRLERSSTSASTRAFALASILCWLGAVASGRFLAYFQ